MFNLEEFKKYWSKEELEKIVNEIRNEFPHDEMMFELHLMRVLKTREK